MADTLDYLLTEYGATEILAELRAHMGGEGEVLSDYQILQAWSDFSGNMFCSGLMAFSELNLGNFAAWLIRNRVWPPKQSDTTP